MNGIHFTWKMKFYALLGSVIFVFLLSLLLPSSNEVFLESFQDKNLINEVYTGRVEDTENHHRSYHKFGEYCLGLDRQYYKYFSIGDRVSKDSGSTFLRINKINSDSVYILDFAHFEGNVFQKCDCNKKRWNCDSLK